LKAARKKLTSDVVRAVVGSLLGSTRRADNSSFGTRAEVVCYRMTGELITAIAATPARKQRIAVDIFGTEGLKVGLQVVHELPLGEVAQALQASSGSGRLRLLATVAITIIVVRIDSVVFRRARAGSNARGPRACLI